MPQEDENDDHHRDDDFDQRALGVGDGAFDELRAVVDGDHAHTLGHTGRNLAQPCLEALDDIERIAALAHDHDAGHHISAPVKIAEAAAYVGAQNDLPDILDANRRSALRGEHCFVKIGNGVDVALATNHVFGAAGFKQPRAGLLVGSSNHLGDFGDGNTVGTQAVRIDIHLVLLNVSSHRCNLRHARNFLQVRLQIPVLKGAKFGQRVLS